MSDKIKYCLPVMFDHACAFQECGQLCAEKVKNVGHIYIGRVEIVNYAFACEVFLKCLLVSYQKEIKGHKLEELVAELPEEVQKALYNAVSQKCLSMCDGFGISHLARISEAFVQWRYCYECHTGKSNTLSVDLGFLYAFCEELREMCCWRIFGTSWDEHKKEDTTWNM